MAKIKDAKPKSTSGGYIRLVNNDQLAKIFIKAQSTVITNGTELEKIITNKSKVITDLEKFINDVNSNQITNGTYLCTKKVVKASKYKMYNHEPDFIVFVVKKEKICKVIELKDGDSFDTKKSTSELETLKEFSNHIAIQIPFIVKFYICCFNQNDKHKIIDGFKKRFSEEQVMTGKELCNLLGIDYNSIISSREKDALDNFNYIVEELSKITEVKNAVQMEKRKHILEDDFYSDEEESLLATDDL